MPRGERVNGPDNRRGTSSPLSALAAFAIGAAVLVVSAAVIGLSAWAITMGVCLTLAGCGALCPQMYGVAMGPFTRNLGLIGGILSVGGYLIVSVAMAIGALPERSLGWLCVTCGIVALGLLGWATSRGRSPQNA
jgi:DHA1 family bicyclomycin/chloramphenicol resistance-like MFS transporter